MEQTVGNLKLPPQAPMTELRFDPDNLLRPPQFFKTGESVKLGLILPFEILQLRNEAMYMTPIANSGSIDDGSMSSQNLV